MTPQARKLVSTATHELIHCNTAAEIYAHMRIILVRAYALKVSEERRLTNITYTHPIQHQTLQNPQRMLQQDYPGTSSTLQEEREDNAVCPKPSISSDIYDYNQL